jgi:transcription elongation factor Elf1
MGQAWKTRMAGKFFCPHCGALYEVMSARATNVGSSPECVVCRTDMQSRAEVPVRRAYRLIQRPEAASDF